MLRTLKELLTKFFSKDWKKILSAWKWIYCYVQKYWLQILLYTGLGLFGTVFGLLSSVVSKNLIDAVTGVRTGAIGWAAAAYAGLGISRIVLNLINGRISLKIQTKVKHEIQADVFDQIMRTDWESMSDYTTGDLLVRANGDAMTIAGSVLSFLPSAVTSICNFIGAFVIVCRHDPAMALIALAGAPVTFLTSQYRLTKMRAFQKENQNLYSQKMTFDQETFQNVQDIKAFNLIDRFSAKMRDLQEKSLDLSLRQYRYQSITSLIVSLTGLAVSYGCYGFAIYRLWQGRISFGTMTLFVSMASSLTGSFSSVVNLVPTAIRAATSAERIMEVVQLPREYFIYGDQAEQIRKTARTQGVYFRAENFAFHYKDGREVYTESSLEANPGEIIGLVGPSGQGKTTTLRILLGLLKPDGGTMVIGNPGGMTIPISPSSRCLFSYVPQGNTMFSGTISENLRMIRPDATDEDLEEVLKMACAWSFVSQLEDGIHARIGERGKGLSEGQNQRLCIARALLADAPILLLDEATSALDMETERQVLKNIIRKDPHRIILVVAHRPSVFSMCTHVYRIADGKIALTTDLSDSL